MELWKDYSDVDQKRLPQLLEDMIPYYERIAVYSVDKEFVRNNKYTFDFKKTGYNHLCLETDNLLAAN